MSVPAQVCEHGIEHVELLPAINDDDGGIIVEMKEAMDSEVFVTLLRASVSEWRRQGKKGVWIKLPIGLASLVEPTVKEGFRYHHAEPKYLMLVYWIPETTCTIPAKASNRAVIGAIVLNDKRELLVVQEKSGKFQGMGVWKIPTGVVDEGENVFEAATREVKEETGIDTEFLEVLAVRQSHKTLFEMSDVLFICMMRPLSLDIQKQELEIEAAQWMPFQDYAAQTFVQKHQLFKYITDLCLAKLHGDYRGFSPLPITSTFNNSTSYLYLNSRDLNYSEQFLNSF
ncbi:hypothetical protein F2P56_021014 [Juglans regia]|uniref:Nudix hydrolase 10-like n=2 Tax=Juglans regia TaxID=51240 RepID=A0A2I4F0Y6_JUGRE|nr:nudix hydrolase 10-like [Juglans regia]XP_018825318.1 nudix hydrolase 10-like [Juglans regia]XP_035550069.1 nudix hydrolase 10-like [Juglans regia]KAF5461196.1 hypothetical protein F2P56_021014 [Juglans regia]